MPRRLPAFYEAKAIQAVILQRIMDPKVESKDLGHLARAWDVLEERKRIMRMQPKPRDMDVVRPNRTIQGVPAKESLLIEATPGDTTPERGQS
jgi:hypothetical protein